jgi:hypothetical protein
VKRTTRDRTAAADRDTLRPEYDFSRAVRGVTAARYAQATNVVVIDAEVLDVFPDGPSVNEALKALAPSFGEVAAACGGGEAPDLGIEPTAPAEASADTSVNCPSPR